VAAYDAFAWFYERYWNEEFHSLAFPILERIWVPRLRPGSRILDVCCGTGYLAALLAEKGYRVAGIDASREMIAFARARVPTAEFQVAAATDFRIAPRCDAAVSTFDSINHILDPDGLRRAFRNIAASLKRGAPFVFDVLLEEAYLTRWGDGFSIVRDDHVLVINGTGFHPGSRIAECRLTLFRRIGNAWQRADTIVHERCYSAAEIDEALAGAGFTGTVCYDARDLGMGGTLGIGRTFYLATKR